MGELRSYLSFFCFTFSYSVSILASLLVYTTISFLLFANVNSFDPLIQFPILKNTTGKSITLIYVNEFGAKGDGITDDTKIFQHIWKIACSSPLRPKIIIPHRYTFLVRPIDFVGPCRSKVSLVPCRHAPTAMSFHRCNNLKVRNLRMLNSQQMHISISNCINVEVSRIKVQAPAKSPNTDGIHISSSTLVGIRDCSIRTGDDCISIVGNSSRILVKNIACGPGHGISIGSLGKSNSWSQVQNVLVDGAYLSNTENGVRIKTWQVGNQSY
ncbi:probable polygalacturonase At1g80170 isoform X2 [Lycium ferocissimum]|uniref:probable polygalacturonase At1g80170 isoform X2 n=1 Tax=Lycium ferocissimum TaxID=112874 RepID=UPI0028168766|nr:probable polygalacturonase At1g80170 isoform X2 [Lycium ferocissimum]